MKDGRYLVSPTSEGSLAIYEKNDPSCLIDKIAYTHGSIDAMVTFLLS